MSGSYTNTDGRTESLNAGAAHDTGLYDPNRHDNQIVAVFADRAAAAVARESLLAGGVPEGAVEVIDHAAGDAAPGASHVEDRNQEVGVWGVIKNLFAPEQEHGDFREALGRGHAMVVVSPTPQTDRHRAIQLLEAAGPIDFDAKLAEWRQAGYDAMGAARATDIGRREPTITSGGAGTGYGEQGAGRDLPPMQPEVGTRLTETVSVPASQSGGAPTDKTREPEAERQSSLGSPGAPRAGWREPTGGGGRVRSYVADRGGAGQVRLREDPVASSGPAAASSDVSPLT